jgi:hypothetical protein
VCYNPFVMRQTVRVNLPTPDRATVALCAVIVGLIGLHLVGAYISFSTGRPPAQPPRLLSLHGEINLTTAFSSFLAAATTVVLAAIGRAAEDEGDRDARNWYALALLFAWIAVDEVSAVHETVGYLIRGQIDARGIFHFAWVILAIPIVALVALGLAGFLRRLPARSRRGLAIAAVIYGSGAIGFEMAGGVVIERTPDPHAPFWILAAVEEVVEMIGLLLFLRTALEVAHDRVDSVTLRLSQRAV